MMRQALLLCLCAFTIISCADMVVDDNTNQRNLNDFESAWKTTQIHYPFFQLKKVNWDSLYLVYRPRAEQAKGDEIYSVLFDMLKELKDGHIEVDTKGGFEVQVYSWPRDVDRSSFSPIVVNKYMGKEYKLAGNNNFGYGEFGGLGYIYISTFTEGDWVKDFDPILNSMIAAKGLILDVRNNGGGNGTTIDFILSRFITSAIQERKYYPTGQYMEWTVDPRGSSPYSRPVIVLVNGASFSAAEIFPEYMRYCRNVLVVGDTTGGGGGSNDIYKLPSGKRIRLPNSYLLRRDGAYIEWNGIIPDVVVEQTEHDKLNGKDPQLEKAIEILNTSATLER